MVVASKRYARVSPDPAATSSALRSIGYRLEAAVADIVDNSVAAGGRHIDVQFQWAGQKSWISISDDANGMTAAELVEAMRIGTHHGKVRESDDLGRFGLGLKTASFSHARQLTVATRLANARSRHTRSWDLDHLAATKEWELQTGAVPPARAALKAFDPKPGTVVVWTRLDRLDLDDTEAARTRFLQTIEVVQRHLGMVFHRFLSRRGARRVRIQVNGHDVTVWNPLDTGKGLIEELPGEEVDVDGHPVRITPYLLPNLRPLARKELVALGGPPGLGLGQGFYVYRNDRIVVAGGWLGMYEATDRHRQARVAVDFTSSLDDVWRIDIAKGHVAVPPSVEHALRRCADRARERAAKSASTRAAGNRRTVPSSVVPLWITTVRDGTPRMTVNRDHPLVLAALEERPGRESTLR